MNLNKAGHFEGGGRFLTEKTIYEVYFKSAFTCNWDEISCWDETHPGMKEFVYTRVSSQDETNRISTPDEI